MEKLLSLNKDFLFKKAYAKGKSYVSRSVVLYSLKNADPHSTLLGITVSAKRGNAVKRTRMRRVIREAYRQLYPTIKKGYIIVIVARSACLTAKSDTVRGELASLINKAGLSAE